MSRFFARTSRPAITGALVLTTLALAAPAADAAGTSLVDRDVVPQIASGRLSLVVDAPNGGIENNVRVARVGDRYEVKDNRAGARAQVASGCTQFLSGDPVTDALVTCPVRDLFGIGIFLRDGNDTVHNATDLPAFIMVHSGDDQAIGGSAGDRILGDTGNDTLSGEGGDDSIDGDEGDDLLDGGQGKDDLNGGDGTDMLFGGPGPDVLEDSPGPDDFHGGTDAVAGRPEPVDVVSYTRGTVTDDPPIFVTLDGVSNDGPAGEFDNVRGDVEKVRGANGPDRFTGNDLPNEFDGDDAGDLLEGKGGADTLHGDYGVDEIHGGEGPDTITGGGDADVVTGDGGDDLLDGDGRSRGYPDRIEGGTGGDTVTYADRSEPVSVDFDGAADDGEANEKDTVGTDVEHAIGGKGADTLTGDARFNRLAGGDGADRITGGAGADELDGGAGDDTILARDGVADKITCGPGVDTVDADPIDVLAADCEPPAAAPPAPAPAPAPAPVVDVPPVVGGEGGPAAQACPVVRIATRRAKLTRGSVLRVKLAAARGGAACAAKATVGSRTVTVRVAPGRTATARFPLSRALRKRVAARGGRTVQVTVRVRTVDAAGRAAATRGKVRLLRR